MEGTAQEAGPTVRVVFTTTVESLQLPESKRLLLVPADIRRYGLSRILNSESMLNTSSSPIPFDFLVNGTFLRSTLEDYLHDNGLSLEKDLTLQYVRSLVPPVYEASFEHDDWVSSVDVLSSTSSPAGASGSDRVLLSASYDGLLRIWDRSGQLLATSSTTSRGAMCALKSARFLSPTRVVAAGMDRAVRVWKYAQSPDQPSGELRLDLELYGHRGVVHSVAVDASANNHILTASADGAVGLWTTSKKLAPEASPERLPQTYATKKRKPATSTTTVPQRGPLALMPIHARPASAAFFDPRNPSTTAYSVSQDHTLRVLDLPTSRVVSTVTTATPLLSACWLPGASTPLVAAGTSSRNVVLIDPRREGGSRTTSVMTLRGHVNVVSALAPSPENDYSLVSGSHDGTCRVWDLRSVRSSAGVPEGGGEAGGPVGEAVYVIERESLGGKKRPIAGEACKVFGVVWDRTWGIVSGGEDKRVQINRGKGVVSAAEDS